MGDYKGTIHIVRERLLERSLALTDSQFKVWIILTNIANYKDVSFHDGETIRRGERFVSLSQLKVLTKKSVPTLRKSLDELESLGILASRPYLNSVIYTLKDYSSTTSEEVYQNVKATFTKSGLCKSYLHETSNFVKATCTKTENRESHLHEIGDFVQATFTKEGLRESSESETDYESHFHESGDFVKATCTSEEALEEVYFDSEGGDNEPPLSCKPLSQGCESHFHKGVKATFTKPPISCKPLSTKEEYNKKKKKKEEEEQTTRTKKRFGTKKSPFVKESPVEDVEEVEQKDDLQTSTESRDITEEEFLNKVRSRGLVKGRADREKTLSEEVNDLVRKGVGL